MGHWPLFIICGILRQRSGTLKANYAIISVAHGLEVIKM